MIKGLTNGGICGIRFGPEGLDMRFGRFGDTRCCGLDITAPYI